MVFPVLVVAACVGVFLIFGLISYEPKSLSDYLVDMRSGGASRRWHAAFELSKKLAFQRGLSHPENPEEGSADAEQKALAADSGFVPSLLELYDTSKHDDPRLRQYLTLCLGYVEGPGVPETLNNSLSDPDPVVRFYAVWALAVRHDTGAVPRLLEMLKQEDPALRKVIVYSLGALGDTRAVPALQELLNDAQPDIRWNAALALARFGDASGVPVLATMLDRDYLKNVDGMSYAQQEQVMINAVRACALLKDPVLNKKLEEISGRDKSLKVRQAALQALKQEPTP